VVDATRHLAEERDPEPVPIEGAYEIASLARAFNEMAEQLARARAAEKQFLLSVSHELKTPLTAIRGYAEGVADGAFDMDEAGETIYIDAARLGRAPPPPRFAGPPGASQPAPQTWPRRSRRSRSRPRASTGSSATCSTSRG